MKAPLYSIRRLEHVYRGRPVLTIDHLDLRRGGIVGVIGPNGSGKSTLLRIAGFVERPTVGEVLFEGKPVGPFAPEARGRVSLLPQEPFLMKRTVRNNVAYGLRIRKAGAQMAERVDQALALVGLRGRDFSQRPSYALSGGEAQRVALAARLILKPEVLLLDEPTANVDGVSAQLIQDAALKAQRDWGTTLIIASHDWQWLYEVSDTILHLFKGRVAGSGREDTIGGPWDWSESAGWGKSLADGQRLLTPPPPSPDAGAVVAGLRLMGVDEVSANDPAGCTLDGVITRLALEKVSGAVRVTMVVAGLPLSVVLSPHQVREQALYPGRPARLAYARQDIRWV